MRCFTLKEISEWARSMPHFVFVEEVVVSILIVLITINDCDIDDAKLHPISGRGVTVFGKSVALSGNEGTYFFTQHDWGPPFF